MKRDDYLSQPEVADFLDWAGHLMRGEWGLEHSWTEKRNGESFRCSTLYQAFQGYRWKRDTFADTARKFDDFRRDLDSIGVIANPAQRDLFVEVAREVVGWGGINNLKRLNEWGQMAPRQLQSHIAETRRKLNPATANTDELDDFPYMGAGFSKIYAALIPGLPIYDSRVACALACLVRLYCQDAGRPRVPALLTFGVPESRGNEGGRCQKPALRYGQDEKYAKANLQFAWLLAGLTANPGQFGNLPANRRVDAVQSALFMLGYARLRDDAIVKESRT